MAGRQVVVTNGFHVGPPRASRTGSLLVTGRVSIARACGIAMHAELSDPPPREPGPRPRTARRSCPSASMSMFSPPGSRRQARHRPHLADERR